MKIAKLLSHLLFSTSIFCTPSCCTTSQGKHAVNQQHQKSVFICSMHPEIIANQPGKCPKCGMVLEARDVSKKSGSSNVDHSGHTSSSHTGGCH